MLTLLTSVLPPTLVRRVLSKAAVSVRARADCVCVLRADCVCAAKAVAVRAEAKAVAVCVLRKFVVFLRVHICKFRNGFVHSKVYQNHRVTVSCTFEYPSNDFTVRIRRCNGKIGGKEKVHTPIPRRVTLGLQTSATATPAHLYRYP